MAQKETAYVKKKKWRKKKGLDLRKKGRERKLQQQQQNHGLTTTISAS
jgi:hypothetical protein